MPGGKRETNETDVDALAREIREELACDLVRADTIFYSNYVAQAFGEPEGVLVCMNSYLGAILGPSGGGFVGRPAAGKCN